MSFDWLRCRRMLMAVLLNSLFFCSVVGEEIKLKVPQLTPEEENSPHMPLHLKCDACQAVAYQIKVALETATRKRVGLSESEILELLEDVCKSKLNEYGIKVVDGKNRLSGPGLETEKTMAMTQMGGKWPLRIRELCRSYLGDLEETEVFNTFKEDPGALMKFICHEVIGDCNDAPFYYDEF